MPFRTINPAPGRRVEEVSVGIFKTPGDPPRIRITFHESLCEKMGWGPTSLVEILIGDGPDLGMIRLKPASVKGFTLRKVQRGARLVVHIPAGKGSPDFWRSGAAEYGLNDGTMTIRLPWAKPALRAVG